MLQQHELDQIDKGFTKIMIIWIALLSSLGFYLVICKAAVNQVVVSMAVSRLEVFNYSLIIMSALRLACSYLLRKILIG